MNKTEEYIKYMNENKEHKQKYIKCVTTKCNDYIKEYFSNYVIILNKLQVKIKKYKNNKIEIEQVIEELYNIIIKIILSINNKKYLKCIVDNCNELYNNYLKSLKQDPFLKMMLQYKVSKPDVEMIFKQDVISDIERLKKNLEKFLISNSKIDIETLTKNINENITIIRKLLKIAYTNNINFIIMKLKNKFNQIHNKDLMIDKAIKFIDLLKNLFKDTDRLKKMIQDPEYMKKILEKKFANIK
jgi:hypothetical protein